MALAIYYNQNHDTILIKIHPHRHDSILSEGDVTKMFKDNKIVSLNIKNASKNFVNIQPGMLYPSDDLITKINNLAKTDLIFDKSFIVAYINKCELIEGTHLHKLSVDHGSQNNLQIICGASNVAQGQKVVLCTTDSFMPNGTYISASKLKGLDSFGMICSQKELNITGFNQDGIIVLTKNYKIGEEFMGIYKC